MGIKININGLKNGVNPKLEKVNTILEKVVDSITSLDIPNDFSYKSTLKNYPSKIRDIKKDIRTIKKDITKIITDFEKAEKSSAALLNKGMAMMDALIPGASKALTSINDAGDTADLGDYLKNLGNSVYQTGAKVVDSVISVNKKFYGSLLKKTGSVLASGANMSLAFFKGLGNVGEHIWDAGRIVQTVADTPKTLVADAITYLFTKDKKNFTSWTKSAWKNTMTEVSTKHVENAFSSFYKKTAVGKFLDEHAGKYFKSDGTVANISSGLGEVAGIAVISALTAGVGGVAAGGTAAGGAAAGAAGSAAAGAGAATSIQTAINATVATISGFGKYTEGKWAEIRDDYHKNLQKKYENGEISKQDLKTMKDDWTTLKNAFSGMAYGGLNGMWEGVQWGVGSALGTGGKVFKSASNKANAAARVFIDTVFNAGDTVVRAGTSVLTTDDVSFKEAFEKAGGIKGVVADVFIGLIGSAGGEIANLKTNSKIKNTSKSNSKPETIKNLKVNAKSETIKKPKVNAKPETIKKPKVNAKPETIKTPTNYLNYSKTPSINGITSFRSELNDKYILENIMPKLKTSKELRDAGITSEQIESACKNVVIVSNRKKLQEIYRTSTGKQMPTGWIAFNCRNISYVSAEVSDNVVIHEIVHSLGNINNEKRQFKEIYREINEAVTDNITNTITRIVGNSSYKSNAELVNNIDMVIEQALGLKFLSLNSYKARDITHYKNALDSLVGEGFTDELAQNMYKVVHSSDPREIAKSKENLNDLFGFFLQEINFRIDRRKK